MTNLRKSAQPVDRFQAPYPPSLIDRLILFIERLPGSFWLLYAVLFLLQSILNLIISWMDGWLQAFTFNPILLLYPAWLWGSLAIMTHLNAVAVKALTTFSPLLHLEKGELDHLKYELTTMPGRGAFYNAALWVIVYVILNVVTYKAFYIDYNLGPLFSLVIFTQGLFTFITGGAIYYHSFRQLRLVNRIVLTVRTFNLFHLDPVYAFSGLTAQTGVSWIILLSATYLCFPIQLANEWYIALLVLQLILAAAAFVLPLWVVHRRLVHEKRRLITELNRRTETTLQRYHHCLDDGQLGSLEQLNHAFTGLQAEREILQAIPTWPWRTETLTGFLSAIVLPLAIFIIQLILQKILE